MRTRLAVVSLLLALGVSPARGQVVQLTVPGDTGLRVVVGDSGRVRLEVATIPSATGVSAYDITIFFDGSRIFLARADAVAGANLPAPTVASGTDSVRLTAAGAGIATGNAALADLWFRIPLGVVEGSLLSLRVNTLTSVTGAVNLVPAHRTRVLNACQANTFWGDVTGEHAITSRDALVALTAAVGLPTASFDITPGDVDEDGLVTSRDALMILSHSIRLYSGSNRMATPQARRCAPLATLPNDLTFLRGGVAWRVNAGDTVPVAVPLPIAPDNQYRGVLSPDGQRFLFTHYVGNSPFWYYEVMSSTAPFTTVDTLTRNGASTYDVGADWAPDGRRIAFISSRVSPSAVFKMDANGANQTQLSNSSVTVRTDQHVAFHPDGKRIAFVGYSACCSYGIWVTHADSSAFIQQEVLAGTSGHNPTEVGWNVAGDSLFYRNNTASQIYAVPYVAGAPGPATGVVAAHLQSTQDSHAHSAIGPLFRSLLVHPYDLYLQRSSEGRTLRVVRGNSSVVFNMPGIRRNSTYISTVAISSPTSPQNVAISASFTATAVVTDANPTGTNSTPGILQWISRNTGVATVSLTGDRTASITGVANGSTYVVVTAGGWRSDSIQVLVP